MPTRVWRKGVLDGEDFPLAEVSEHLEDPDTLVWVDFALRQRNSCTSSPLSSAYMSLR